MSYEYMKAKAEAIKIHVFKLHKLSGSELSEELNLIKALTVELRQEIDKKLRSLIIS